MRRMMLVSSAVIICLSTIAHAKIMDFYTPRQKTLGAYHIAQGKVTNVTKDTIVVQVEAAWKGKLKTGSVTISKSDFHFEQSQEFLELKKDDVVICFVFSETLPEDRKFEVKYLSSKRLLPVKYTDEIRKEIGSQLADLEWIQKLQEMHKSKSADSMDSPDKK